MQLTHKSVAREGMLVPFPQTEAEANRSGHSGG